MELFDRAENDLLNLIRDYPDYNIQFNFSGGKDSSAIVGLLLSLLYKGNLNTSELTRIIIFHSDTTIESPLFYQCTNKILSEFEKKGLSVYIGRADIEKRFFAQLFGFGKPVPNYGVRWCTDNLKIKVAEKVAKSLGTKTIIVTGEHYGESNNRDKKLSGCGSSECGSDSFKSKKSSKSQQIIYRAIENWRSCQVWEYLAHLDHHGIINFYNEIAKVYEISNDLDTNKSLRMGCIGCPVISIKNHYSTDNKGIPSALSLRLSLLYNELRNDDLRVRNPKRYDEITGEFGSKTNGGYGAIALDARRYYWEVFKSLHDEFLTVGISLMCPEEKRFIEKCLTTRQYPITYHCKQGLIDILESEWQTRKPAWLKK